jgi:hypothetical protein
MNICKGDHVVLPSKRSGVVVEPAGNRVMPLHALVRLDKPEGKLACIWVAPALLTLCGGKTRG